MHFIKHFNWHRTGGFLWHKHEIAIQEHLVHRTNRQERLQMLPKEEQRVIAERQVQREKQVQGIQRADPKALRRTCFYMK